MAVLFDVSGRCVCAFVCNLAHLTVISVAMKEVFHSILLWGLPASTYSIATPITSGRALVRCSYFLHTRDRVMAVSAIKILECVLLHFVEHY